MASPPSGSGGEHRGTCRSSDTRDHALAVGARRAQEVRDYLILFGVPPAQLTATSWGKERLDRRQQRGGARRQPPGPDGPGPLGSGGAALEAACGQPRARLALGFGDFAGGHFARDLGPAFLAPLASRQSREIEPFMRFDEVDRSAPAAGRKSHPKLEQRVEIALFGIGEPASNEELGPFSLIAPMTISLPVGGRLSGDPE